MNYFKQGIIYFIVLALIDSLAVMIYPIDFTYTRISFIPHFAIIGLLIYAKRLNWKNRLIVGGLAGLLTDMFITDTFFIYTFLYPFFCLMLTFFDHWVLDKRFAFFIIMGFVFILDFIPFSLNFLLQPYPATIHEWFYYMEMLTLIINAFAIPILSMIWDILYQKAYLKRQKTIRKSIKM